MTSLISFSPLMRSTVGFDRFSDLFDTVVQGKEERFDAYPPYNIEKTGEDAYRIVMAVAGFKMGDLNIVAKGDQLTVSGQIEDKAAEAGTSYLHRGIAARAFQRSFRLADYIKVTAAELRDGLLTMQLMREVPEAAKPRMIKIKGDAPVVEPAKAN